MSKIEYCRHLQPDFAICNRCDAENAQSLRKMLGSIAGPVDTAEHRLETVSKEIVKTRIHLARLENLQGLLANDFAVLKAAEEVRREGELKPHWSGYPIDSWEADWYNQHYPDGQPY